MKILFYSCLLSIISVMAVSGAPSLKGRAFLAGEKGNGIVLLNGFPVVNAVAGPEYSVTQKVPVITLRKGKNTLEAALWTDSSAQFILKFADVAEGADLQLIIESKVLPEKKREWEVKIGDNNSEDILRVAVEENERAEVSLGSGAPKGGNRIKAVALEEAKKNEAGWLIVRFDFESALGRGDEKFPWEDLEPIKDAKSELPSIRKAIQTYLEALEAEDLDATKSSLQLKMAQEEAAGVMTAAARLEKLKAGFAAMEIKAFGEVSRAQIFPRTPVVLVEQQVGILMRGRRAFQKLYLIKPGETWTIIY